MHHVDQCLKWTMSPAVLSSSQLMAFGCVRERMVFTLTKLSFHAWFMGVTFTGGRNVVSCFVVSWILCLCAGAWSGLICHYYECYVGSDRMWLWHTGPSGILSSRLWSLLMGGGEIPSWSSLLQCSPGFSAVMDTMAVASCFTLGLKIMQFIHRDSYAICLRYIHSLFLDPVVVMNESKRGSNHCHHH